MSEMRFKVVCDCGYVVEDFGREVEAERFAAQHSDDEHEAWVERA